MGWFKTKFGCELWRHSGVSEDCVAVFTHQIQSAHSKRRLDKRTHLFAKLYFKIKVARIFYEHFWFLNFTFFNNNITASLFGLLFENKRKSENISTVKFGNILSVPRRKLFITTIY